MSEPVNAPVGIVLAVRDYLTKLGPLAPVVSDRIFPVLAPQLGGDPPRIRYVRTSDKRTRGLGKDRPLSGTIGLLLICEAYKYADAAAIEDALRGDPDNGLVGLDGLKATIGPAGNQYQVHVTIDDARDDADQPQHADDSWTFRIELDVMVQYESLNSAS